MERCVNVSRLQLDVCFWHLADIDSEDERSLLLGVKRTSLIRSLMSANDPKRTFPLLRAIGLLPQFSPALCFL
jgi:hypothetical protein